MLPPPSLAETQRLLRALVTAPEGVDEALRAGGDPKGERLAALVRGDRGLAAAERLGVYARAYFERLRAALAKDFPDLAAALGEEAFHDLVRVYLMIHPPQRPSIREAGAFLAGFLREDEVAAPLRRHLPCAPDLAAFEWAQIEAFDAADAASLSRDSLASLPPDEWPQLRLEASPALRLLVLQHPVHALADEAPHAEARALAPRETRICVWRQAERVRFRELAPAEHTALLALSRGARFGEICDGVAGDVGEAAAAAETAAFLARWIADGCLREPSAERR